MIVGIDEVGRGAWAGPLVVAAVGLGGAEIDGLTDSKLLSKKKRSTLSRIIKQTAPLVGIGWVSAHDIDAIGLSAALKLAARRAMQQLDLSKVDQIIIDGTINLLDSFPLRNGHAFTRVTLMKKADLLVPSVGAASIIAKVARDDYMKLCDQVFPGYGFAGHVGYGAAAHRESIDLLGVLPIHRASFAPIAACLEVTLSTSDVYKNSHVLKNVTKLQSERRSKTNTNLQDSSENNSKDNGNEGIDRKNTTRVGHRAEQAAVEYLQREGYRIIDQNWKTRWCEIDVIALRDNVVHFVEVKYRSKVDQGGGIAAITPKKLRQMRFAAELWLQYHPDRDARLSVIDIAGDDMSVVQFLESVS